MEELVHEAKNGVLLQNFTSGIEDPLGGNMQLKVKKGRRIENGELTDIFSSMALSGKVLEFLREIRGVEPGFRHGLEPRVLREGPYRPPHDGDGRAVPRSPARSWGRDDRLLRCRLHRLPRRRPAPVEAATSPWEVFGERVRPLRDPPERRPDRDGAGAGRGRGVRPPGLPSGRGSDGRRGRLRDLAQRRRGPCGGRARPRRIAKFARFPARRVDLPGDGGAPGHGRDRRPGDLGAPGRGDATASPTRFCARWRGRRGSCRASARSV